MSKSTDLKANFQEAAEFATNYYSVLPRHITAIYEGKQPITRTFQPGEGKLLQSFVEKYNTAGANIYFAVNEIDKAAWNKKAAKKHVTGVTALQVDLDNLSEDALQRLVKFEPKPSIILCSGGGYQAFWFLAGTEEYEPMTFDQIEALNKVIAKKVGGDNCHNIDRIMRLPGTINYLPLLKNISGNVLQGSPQEKVHYALTGEKPHRDSKVLQMLGNFKVSELTTAQLRRWHNLVRVEAEHHTANRVMSMLKGILALAEEDFGVRVCSMPTNLARRKSKPKKDILTAEEIARFIAHAKLNPDRSLYVIFPLLSGARISEILGLLWEDIDLDRNIISIRRVQERDGTTTNTTKTEAGEREIPISPTLRTMLLEWRLRCPRLEGKLYRVFPDPGVQRQWPLPRIGGGGPILYSNFLKRYWKTAFVNSGVRYVSLHACRHSFISILQSQGVDLAVVSEIVGHSNPAVTLGHYTQAVRGGAEALAMLDKAYQGE